MNRREIFVAVIVLILIGVLGYLVFMNQLGSNTAAVLPATRQYVDTTYGYSFQYPAQDIVQEGSPQYVVVGQQDGQNVDGIAEADAEFSSSSSQYTSFQAFVQTQAALDCDASGPGENISCPSLQSMQPFATQSGLSGDEFYLNEVTTNTSGATLNTATFGPIFAFDISGNTPQENAQFSALIIRPLISSTSTDPATVEAIANSLQFVTTGQ